MGCDYYVIVSLNVIYSNQETRYVELDRERYYFSYFHSSSVDSDDAEYSEEIKKDRKQQLEKHKSSKTLMENSVWTITRKTKQDYYLNAIKSQYPDDDLNEIVSIIKKSYTMLR